MECLRKIDNLGPEITIVQASLQAHTSVQQTYWISDFVIPLLHCAHLRAWGRFEAHCRRAAHGLSQENPRRNSFRRRFRPGDANSRNPCPASANLHAAKPAETFHAPG